MLPKYVASLRLWGFDFLPFEWCVTPDKQTGADSTHPTEDCFWQSGKHHCFAVNKCQRGNWLTHLGCLLGPLWHYPWCRPALSGQLVLKRTHKVFSLLESHYRFLSITKNAKEVIYITNSTLFSPLNCCNDCNYTIFPKLIATKLLSISNPVLHAINLLVYR